MISGVNLDELLENQNEKANSNPGD